MKELQLIDERIVLGKEFKVYGTPEEPLFLAKDVAEWIDYQKTAKGAYNVSKMLNVVDDDEKIKVLCGITNRDTTSKARKTQELWALTEFGIYEVLFLSRKPIAKQFKKEVKHILKEIRLKGYYVSSTITEEQFAELQDEVNYQGQVIRALKGQAKQQGKKIQQQEQQIQKFAAVYNSETAIYTFSNLAAEFGLKTAQNLRCILIAHGVIVRNMINGQAVDEIAPNYQPELIKYKLVHNKRWNYNGDIYQNLQFTEKGRIWLKLRLKEWGNI